MLLAQSAMRRQAAPAPPRARAARSGHGGAFLPAPPVLPKGETTGQAPLPRYKDLGPEASPRPRRKRCCLCPRLQAGMGSSACGGGMGSPGGGKSS